MKKQKKNTVTIERYEPDVVKGLSLSQVEERKKNKLTNKCKIKSSKTYLGIIIENTFTYFNLIWAIIIFAYIYVGSYNNLLFVVVIALNTLIAIIQECKAKYVVEKLSLVTAPKTEVIRNGVKSKILSSGIVLDDIITLEVGNQVPADCIMVDGYVEMNESLLTGESNAIKKRSGDELLAGSFVVSGTCSARINKIGNQSYIQTIAMESKKFKSPNSNLFKDLNTIIKYIGIAIIPIAIIMYYNNITASGDFVTAVTKTCGALTGMVPAGMFLLVTVALAVGVIKLSRKKTLVQDLYCIEMLARADTLCLDKTGTITDGTMQVTSLQIMDNEFLEKKVSECVAIEIKNTNEILENTLNEKTTEENQKEKNDKTSSALIPPTTLVEKINTDEKNELRINENSDITINTDNLKEATFQIIMSSYLASQTSVNQTSYALIKKFGNNSIIEPDKVLPFSSERKHSATYFKNLGSFFLGAPEFVCKNIDEGLQNQINTLNEQSQRVLMISYTPDEFSEDDVVYENLVPYAIIALEDHIREDAIETIDWFKKNDVQIKIISGDNPATVSAIARRVGVEGSERCISLEGVSLQDVGTLAEKFTVFGRVSPEQKHILVKSLKNKGHVVAMTGDGVNDTLALKEADCSIAMADGSDVARNISQLVLMDSKFSSLPSVVREGRQVVNNIQNSSTLFLMKTFLSFMVAFFVILLATTYPFESVQLLLIEVFVIGIPSFILALEPNNEKIKGAFIPSVLKKAIPSGFLIFLNVGIVIILNRYGVINIAEMETLTVLMLTFTGLLNLLRITYPYTPMGAVAAIIAIVCTTAATVIIPEFFEMFVFNGTVSLIALILLSCSIPYLIFLPRLEKLVIKIFSNPKKNKAKEEPPLA